MLSAGLFLLLQALNQNTQFFENASDVVADGFEPRSQQFKIGGLVAEQSIESEGLTTKFRIVDFERDMAKNLYVTYTQASELLAKHDENYQPKINYREE